MNLQINEDAFKVFQTSINQFQPWNGTKPKNWAKYFYSEKLNPKLSEYVGRPQLLSEDFKKDLTNQELAIVVLSWGGMNRKHGAMLFQNQKWLEIIEGMRRENIKTREEAYALFLELRKNKRLKGMGPAYFTKLICFANPTLKGYIMDQWTSKSINLLFKDKTVELTKSGYVSDKNSATTYENFCLRIERLSELLKIDSMDIEEKLFSSGGLNKGNWRQFVATNWVFSSNLKSSKNIIIINDTDMEPIKFKDAINRLQDIEIVISTLGGRSKLKVKFENGFIIVINSRNNTLKIDETLWEKVMNRILELPQAERGMASRYSVGKKAYNWNNCPNRNAPSIAAIVNHLCK